MGGEGGVDKFPFPVLIDKDGGSSEDLVPVLILAVTIYFKDLGHHMKTSVSLPNEKQSRGIIKDIARFGMTPSLASHCWRLFYFTHLM